MAAFEASVTFDRSLLSLAELTITNDRTGTYYIASLSRVSKAYAVDYAESALVHGAVATRSRLVNGTQAVNLFATGATWADVDDACDVLERAAGQLSYDLTVTMDGRAHTYIASPAESISYADFGTPYVAALCCPVQLVIPVYPIPTES